MKKFNQSITKYFYNNIYIYILTGISFLLRYPYRSPYLEDWDSVQFALGLHQYSVVLHQPHPPGYPLYILLAKITYFFTGNDTEALTLLSVLFGSLVIIPLYFLTKSMFSKTIAYLSSIIFIFLPVEWILSEVANSNMTGLFFTVLLAYCVYTLDKNKAIIIGILAAFTLGIRFTDFPVVIALLSLYIFKIRSLKYSLHLIVSFFIGIFLWLIPLLVITGPKEFLEAYQKIAEYVRWHDTLLGQSYTLKHLIKIRIEYVWILLQQAYTTTFILLSLFSLVIIIFKKEYLKQFRFYFLLVWFISYFIPLVFFYNLELPQYTLPLAPSIVILTSYTLNSIIRNRLFLFSVLLIIVIILFSQTWPQVIKQATVIPPTIQPILYVKENFDSKEATLITSFIFRQFQYYAPEFINYYGPDNVPTTTSTKTIILDYLGLKTDLPFLNQYQLSESKEFTQENLDFSRLHQTSLYIFTKK